MHTVPSLGGCDLGCMQDTCQWCSYTESEDGAWLVFGWIPEILPRGLAAWRECDIHAMGTISRNGDRIQHSYRPLSLEGRMAIVLQTVRATRDGDHVLLSSDRSHRSLYRCLHTWMIVCVLAHRKLRARRYPWTQAAGDITWGLRYSNPSKNCHTIACTVRHLIHPTTGM